VVAQVLWSFVLQTPAYFSDTGDPRKITQTAQRPKRSDRSYTCTWIERIFGWYPDWRNYRGTFKKMKQKFDCWPFSAKCVITVTNSRHRMTGSNSAEKRAADCSNQVTTVRKLKRMSFPQSENGNKFEYPQIFFRRI